MNLTTYLFSFLLLLPHCFFAQQVPDSVITYAEEQLNLFAAAYPGISASVTKGKEVVWNKTIGYQDLEQKTPVTPDTRFNIYSTSKFITGLAFLKLVHNGELKSLDQSVREIDPELPPSYQGITLRFLLTHTSGIRHYKRGNDWKKFNKLRCAKPADALVHFVHDPLNAPAGTEYTYTTYGMVVASHLLEKITGKDYIDALNSLLPFKQPLYLDSEDATKATPYARRGQGYKQVKALSAECKFGGGGLIASSDQLVQAGQMLYDGSIAPLDEVRNLLSSLWPGEQDRGVSFGMGCGIAKESFGPTQVLYANMGGASPGGRSYVMVLADLGVAVAITANCRGDGDKAYQLVLNLAKKFAGV